MTKAIEILKASVPKTCKMVNGRLKGGFDDWESDTGKAIQKAIQALEEVEQYRALGTVEGFKSALYSNLEYYGLFKEYKAKYQEYAKLGTVEELKEARGKQIPQTPRIEGDGYCPDGHLVYDTWICPNCDAEYEIDYDDYDYCPKCGQAIDKSVMEGSEEDD